MSEEKKDSKKCFGKNNIMFAYGFIQLGSSIVSAIALAAIAFGFCSIKKESKIFNKCVAEIIEDGGTNSEAVSYCRYETRTKLYKTIGKHNVFLPRTFF